MTDPEIDKALADLKNQLSKDIRASPVGKVTIPRVLKRLKPPLSILVKTCDQISLEKVITDHLPDFTVIPGEPVVVRRADPVTRPSIPSACHKWVRAKATGCTSGGNCKFRHDLPPGCRY
jgi:hypothetical protein